MKNTVIMEASLRLWTSREQIDRTHSWKIWYFIRKRLFIFLTNCITENYNEIWEPSWIGNLRKENESTQNAL